MSLPGDQPASGEVRDTKSELLSQLSRDSRKKKRKKLVEGGLPRASRQGAGVKI